MIFMNFIEELFDCGSYVLLQNYYKLMIMDYCFLKEHLFLHHDFNHYGTKAKTPFSALVTKLVHSLFFEAHDFFTQCL